MMKSEKTLRLCRDELIRMRGNQSGTVISCQKGALWLTQTNRPGDHLIRPGEAFSIERPGVVLVSALEDSVCTLSCEKGNPLFSVWPFKPCLWRWARRFEGVLRKSLLT
jgi:hypothetical protein